MEKLYKKLERYGQSDYYPFHMPGHKRNPDSVRGDFPFERDITEIEGFDNLHHPEDILLEAQKNVSKLYGTKESYYSVNGSTAALLAAVSAAVPRKGQILVARNCHKAVYHAMYLRELKPTYIYPQMDMKWWINGGIFPDKVERCLAENPEIKAVLITSPTYDGVVSDVKAIAEITHKYEIPLIVDEAHGAHFHFSNYFPTSAVELGADLVIQSFHKTLPAMTQTALIHLNGTLIDRERIRRMLTIYQTSSPSYILMGSIDSCLHMLSEKGKILYTDYTVELEKLRNAIHGNCRWIKMPECSDFDSKYSKDYDRSKLVLSVRDTGMTGKALHEKLLNRYHLQMEMVSADYVLAMTAVGDSRDGYQRLLQALIEIDEEIEQRQKACGLKETEETSERARNEGVYDLNELPAVEQRISIYDAEQSCRENCLLKAADGRVAADYIYLYPPGIPLVTPGEVITERVISVILRWLENGLHVSGVQKDQTVRVVCRNKESEK